MLQGKEKCLRYAVFAREKKVPQLGKGKKNLTIQF